MYSQIDEEAVIDTLFPQAKAGRYIDIGAGGLAESNTYKYYRMGWRGLLVEPRPDVAEELRTARPKDVLVQATIGDRDGEVPMYHTGNLTRITPMTDAEPVAFRCRCLTMATLLAEHPQFQVVDFASIDVEGAEEMVLAATPFEIFRPNVLIIEYNTAGYSSDARGSWEPYVLPFYEPVYYNGVNGFYVRRAVERPRPGTPG